MDGEATAVTPRFAADAVRAAATELLRALGMDVEFARDIATVLVEGDLLGHDTHGLALLASYLGEIESGSMRSHGCYRIVNERAATAIWDGERLPGAWLTLRAIEDAIDRAQRFGAGTVVIRRSHHIGCLAAYLSHATEQGFVVLLSCSDPSSASVAPHGGLKALFTPDPIAFGVPTKSDPILIDLSASLTTNGMTARLHKAGRRLAHPWLQDAEGRVTDDPAVLFREPRGTILPAGGADAGHKGYALALIVELLTGGLAGHGRADPKEGWGATVCVQVWDPAAFGGADDFLRQADWIADACRSNPPRPGTDAVRVPGQRALQRRREQVERGIALHESIVPALLPWINKLKVDWPAPL